MNILVINAWSSSLKCCFFKGDSLKNNLDITISRIWETESEITIVTNSEDQTLTVAVKDHWEALKNILDIIVEKAIVKNILEIDAVWYRVVHGWSYFSDSVIIDEDVKKRIHECIEIAPLHNPINLACIELGKEHIPNASHIAVFDTAFHQTMPEKNYLYAIPKEYSEKYKIRKYGFHGISHQYVSQKLDEITGEKNKKVISCHIGNWASISAIQEGECINTSMWFTPTDGLVMGTRVGNIDPWAILFLQEKEGLTTKEIDAILNKKSWVLWLTWEVWDMRDLEYGIELGTPWYALALDIYITRIVRYIGSYIADLWGVDAIILTAWVMENSSNIRRLIAERLAFAWVEFDDFQNLFRWETRTISTPQSKTRLIVIPTDEEQMIAKEVKKLI